MGILPLISRPSSIAEPRLPCFEKMGRQIVCRKRDYLSTTRKSFLLMAISQGYLYTILIRAAAQRCYFTQQVGLASRMVAVKYNQV